jgi:hypothetical protein
LFISTTIVAFPKHSKLNRVFFVSTVGSFINQQLPSDLQLLISNVSFTFHFIVVIQLGNYTAFNANPSLLTPVGHLPRTIICCEWHSNNYKAAHKMFGFVCYMFAAVNGFRLTNYILQFLLQTIHYSNHL